MKQTLLTFEKMTLQHNKVVNANIDAKPKIYLSFKIPIRHLLLAERSQDKVKVTCIKIE
jgi:hypothetical protein